MANIAYKVDKKIAKLDSFDYVLFHVGTNDVDNRYSFEAIMFDFGNLLGIVRKKYPKIFIIISSILPRPKNYDETDDFTRRINSYLLDKMSKPYDFKNIKSYMPFVFGGKVRRELFAKGDGGLHLHTLGTSRLRYYFLRTVSSMQ